MTSIVKDNRARGLTHRWRIPTGSQAALHQPQQRCAAIQPKPLLAEVLGQAPAPRIVLHLRPPTLAQKAMNLCNRCQIRNLCKYHNIWRSAWPNQKLQKVLLTQIGQFAMLMGACLLPRSLQFGMQLNVILPFISLPGLSGHAVSSAKQLSLSYLQRLPKSPGCSLLRHPARCLSRSGIRLTGSNLQKQPHTLVCWRPPNASGGDRDHSTDSPVSAILSPPLTTWDCMEIRIRALSRPRLTPRDSTPVANPDSGELAG